MSLLSSLKTNTFTVTVEHNIPAVRTYAARLDSGVLHILVPEHIALDDRHFLQTVLPEHVSNCPGNSLAAYSSCCPSLIHVISQPFHDAHLFGWIDDLLVHCVWAQRTFALLCL